MLLMKDIIDDSNKLIRSISKEVSLPLSKEDHDLLMDMHAFLVASQDEKLSEKYDLRPAVGIANLVFQKECALYMFLILMKTEKLLILQTMHLQILKLFLIHLNNLI